MSFAERGQRIGDNIDRGVENVTRRYTDTKHAFHDTADRGYKSATRNVRATYNVMNKTKRRIAIVFTLLLAIALTYVIIIYISADSIGALSGIATFVVVVWMIPIATLMYYTYNKTDKLSSASHRLSDAITQRDINDNNAANLLNAATNLDQILDSRDRSLNDRTEHINKTDAHLNFRRKILKNREQNLDGRSLHMYKTEKNLKDREQQLNYDRAFNEHLGE